MNEIIIKNNDFGDIHNKSHRLATAVFVVSNLMDENDELKTKIRNLSLKLISNSIGLKDISFLDANNLLSDMEKICLELMSLLDIASVICLISKMNAEVIRGEFRLFISELDKFIAKFEENKSISINGLFERSQILNERNNFTEEDFEIKKMSQTVNENSFKTFPKISAQIRAKTETGHKRKDLRKNTILDFIKRHTDSSIKDIVPNINGCSEKTIQRELIALINEGKIKKTGERRWSKYSII